MKETKARKFKIAGVPVMVALLFVLMVSTIHGSSASPPAPPYTDSYDLDYTAITYYGTWHPDFEIWRWGCQADSAHPQYDPDEDVQLRYPDGSTIKTVDRGDFCQYHLEGSGFIYLDGQWKIINLITPDPNVVEDQAWTANPTDATFDIFTHVDWGLDAPHTHYGLVPWRTVAVNIRGEIHTDKSIPLDSWVYIPEFKDLWVPVARPDDLGSGSTLWNPANESPTSPVHFDWFQHDGYFRVTDISWSLPNWIPVENGKWLDIFGTTTACYEYVMAEIGDSDDHLDIKVYPYVNRPAFVDGGDVFYRYMEVLEFTNPDTATTVAKNYGIYTGWPNDTEQVAFGNFFGASYQSDVDDMLVKASNYAYAAYDTPPPHWIRWAVPASAGITVGDLDGDGVDENIMFQRDGIVRAGFDAHHVWGWDYRWEQPASSTPLPITSGDYDGDGDDDLAMLNNSGGIGIVFVQNGMGYESLMVSANATCLATGDMDGDVDIETGEGKEEILICSDAGVQWLAYDPPSGNVAFTTLTTDKATAAGAIKLDPDNRSDVLVVFEGKSGVYAQYTSHKSGFVKYMDETPEWITPMVVKLDEWYPGGGCSYDEWETYEWYTVNDYVEYDGDAYKCTYYHYSQPGWEPDQPYMWAVWQNLGPCN